tara:strand:- start:4917 stop:5648 length:732 start_codon:yes stop_codon:yes gene_type:complete
MRNYKAGGSWHTVYEADDILPEGLVIKSDWRKGLVGDWVRADDECIIEILRRGKMRVLKGKEKVREYVGTCTGTFPVTKYSKMDTSKREDIYSFSGRKIKSRLDDDRNLTSHEQLFAVLLAQGIGMKEAYLQSFPTNNPRYALNCAKELVKTTRIMTAMKEELKPVLEELEIDEAFVLKNIKEVVLSSEKDDTRLKALFKLADIMDMEDKNRTQVTQLAAGVFKGFSDNVLEEAQRPKEIDSK